MRAASEEVAEVALREARALTSGPVKAPTLAALGHPFRRGRPRAAKRFANTVGARLPTLPIHIQSGDVHRKWRKFKRVTGRGEVWIVQNLSPHAKYVLAQNGTPVMIPRGFWSALNRRMETVNRQEMARTLKRAHRGF